MCGRFNVIDNPGLGELLRDLGIELQLPTSVNVAPTEQVSLIRSNAGEIELLSSRWWLTPSWAKQVDQKYAMFNARSESLASKPAFKKPFHSQRGIVPASSFIEWRVENGSKQAWDIAPDSGAIAFAALWDLWQSEDKTLLSCTLVTTASAPEFLPWHTRMPVMLAANEYERWLDNRQHLDVVDPIFRNELKCALTLTPLARAVGNSRNKSLELLEPMGEVVKLRV